MSLEILKFSNTIHHGNDFYNFINESWLNIKDIPEDYQRWGTFQELEKNNLNKIKKVLENVDDSDDNFLKVKLLYNQLNDTKVRSSKQNFKKINDMINKINAQTTHQDLFSLMVEFDVNFGVNSPINFVIQSSFSNAELNILHLTSGGLGLPDRDYYLLESKKEIRDNYICFIKKYGLCFGVELDSIEIFNLEKQLTEKTLSKVQLRNQNLLNNLTNFDVFANQHPQLKYLYKIFEKANKIPSQINITNPKYLMYFNNLIQTVKLNLWKQYFIFHLLLEFNYCLTLDIEQEYFNFYSKILKGTQTMKSQWIRTIENLNPIIGELIGLMYSKNFFKSDSKIHALEIVNLIKEELRDYLINNDWMEQETKSKALLKLELMNIKIGYPEKIKKNYSDLQILETNTLLENILVTKLFNNTNTLASLYEKLDRDKWLMSAHDVNAYYSSNMNEIVFPAGILQEPFFSPNQDISYNFGGFGMVIGHEITHGFDDEGSKYDAYGNLNNWWTKNDFKKYEEKTKKIVEQYNKYQVDGHNVDGELTLGENIADIGGLSLSFKAFKKYLQCLQIKNKVKINYDLNLTDEQKFFVNFAHIWKSKGRAEDVQQLILLDVHSPSIFRVNGSLRNITEFYEAFNINPTDELYLDPDQRVKIWG
jgi:putative endopeptidase